MSLAGVKRPAVCVVVVIVGTTGVGPAVDPPTVLDVAAVPPNIGAAVPPPATAVVVDVRVEVPTAGDPKITPGKGAFTPTTGTAVVVTAETAPLLQLGTVIVAEDGVVVTPAVAAEVTVVIVVAEGAAVVPDAAAGVTRAAAVADDVPWPMKANAGVVAMVVEVVLWRDRGDSEFLVDGLAVVRPSDM